MCNPLLKIEAALDFFIAHGEPPEDGDLAFLRLIGPDKRGEIRNELTALDGARKSRSNEMLAIITRARNDFESSFEERSRRLREEGRVILPSILPSTLPS